MGAPWTPAFEGWDARVRASFARQGAMKMLGARIDDVSPGRCVIAIDFRPDLAQQHGYFHAGVTSAVADSAGGYAAYTLFPDETEVLTSEYKINLLAPAAGVRLVATGEVIRAGKRITTCLVRVDVVDGANVTPCAIMLQTLVAVTRRPG